MRVPQRLGSVPDLMLVLWLTLSFLLSLSDSERSHHYTWRLNSGKVMPGSAGSISADDGRGGADASSDDQDSFKLQEDMLEILLSTELSPDGTWKKTWQSSRHCSRCRKLGAESAGKVETPPPPPFASSSGHNADDHDYDDDGEVVEEEVEEEEEELDCGRSVNFTYYDHLMGIQNRASHPHIPEPEAAMTFRNKRGLKANRNGEMNIDDIERSLKKAKRGKPKSVELYNQIGNFWRIKGDTQKSIECFRRALAVSPNDANVLLNLAKVLFNLQFLEDSIILTRRSLEVQPPEQNAWAQHLQLGEILKAYNHYQEAALHLRHVLELKPNHRPALNALQEMESLLDSTVHRYTILIIVLLVLAVLLWILSTLDYNMEEFLCPLTTNQAKDGCNRSNRSLQRSHSRSTAAKKFA